MISRALAFSFFMAVVLAGGLWIAINRSGPVAPASRPGPAAPPNIAAAQSQPANSPDPSAEPAPAAAARPDVRDVTPPGFSRVFGAAVPAAPARAPGPLRRQIADAGVRPDGAIIWPGGVLHLHGIAFPQAGRICESAAGERWACGKRAYIALHNKVRGQTIDCEPAEGGQPAFAACFVGRTNLAEWLLAAGFVRVRDGVADKDLLTAEAQARKIGAGLWRDRREAGAPAQERRP